MQSTTQNPPLELAEPSRRLFVTAYPQPTGAGFPRLWDRLSAGDRARAIAAIPLYIAACRNARLRPVDPERYLNWRLWRGFK